MNLNDKVKYQLDEMVKYLLDERAYDAPYDPEELDEWLNGKVELLAAYFEQMQRPYSIVNVIAAVVDELLGAMLSAGEEGRLYSWADSFEDQESWFAALRKMQTAMRAVANDEAITPEVREGLALFWSNFHDLRD